MQSSFEWSLLTAKLHVYSNCFLLPCWAFLAKKHSEIRIYHSQGLQTHLNTSNPIVTVETCRTRTWTFKSFHLLELIKEASTSNEHGRSTGEKGTWNHMESPNNHLDPIGLFQKSRLHYVARFLFRTFWTKAEGNWFKLPTLTELHAQIPWIADSVAILPPTETPDSFALTLSESHKVSILVFEMKEEPQVFLADCSEECTRTQNKTHSLLLSQVHDVTYEIIRLSSECRIWKVMYCIQ